jgi:hypothetical protein
MERQILQEGLTGKKKENAFNRQKVTQLSWVYHLSFLEDIKSGKTNHRHFYYELAALKIYGRNRIDRV